MSALIRAIKDAISFMFEHGIWKSLHMKEAPWMIQLGKYGMCGVMATVLHNVIFFVLAKWFIPALDEHDLPNLTRAWHIVYNNLIAFFFSNLFVYCTNLMFVFTGGRHNRMLEFALFTLVNLIAMIPALAISFYAANSGTETPYAQLIFVICSAMMNFLCRKFFVFKG